MSRPSLALRVRRLLARLPARLLAFNLLLVLVPITGLFYFGLHELLGRYERRLLDAQERSMAQQGRLLAAALSEGADGADGADAAAGSAGTAPDGARASTGPAGPARPAALSAEQAERILVGLEQRLTARLRVYDADGELLADSATLGPRRDQLGEAVEAGDDGSSAESWLYRLGAAPFRIARRWFGDGAAGPGSAAGAGSARGDGRPRETPPEIRAALAGRYGARARPTPGDQRSLTLHVAIPVRGGAGGDLVLGAAQASQSTYRILEELRRVRLSFFEIFLVSLAGAALLSVVAAATIARPIRRLRSEAATLVDRRGRLRGTFSGSDAQDEVGDLARTLENLSHRIEGHVRFVEAFAADVSHELRNPLTSIRAATELLEDADDPEERRALLATAAAEVARMERLLAAVREISLIDSHLDEELSDEPGGRVELGGLLEGLAEAIRLRSPEGTALVLDLPPEPVEVRGAPERLAQVVENLIDNALGFSPAGGEIRARLAVEGDRQAPEAVLTVSDRGPGIPPEHLDRVFDRFFSYRPDGDEGDGRAGAAHGDRVGAAHGDQVGAAHHVGLGLSIVAAIVEAYGGSVRARNRPGGGAELEIRLPARGGPTPDPTPDEE
jgi:two-component system sensor histidine kinase ChvG